MFSYLEIARSGNLRKDREARPPEFSAFCFLPTAFCLLLTR